MRCPRCGLTKPLSDFPKDRSNSKGRQSCCFLCGREVSRARYLKAKLRGLLAPGTPTAPTWVYEAVLADRELFRCGPHYTPRSKR